MGLREFGSLLFPTPTQSPVEGSASFAKGGAKITLLSAGSLKQPVPESSKAWHLTRVLFAKANATCFDTFAIPYFEAILPRVAC